MIMRFYLIIMFIKIMISFSFDLFNKFQLNYFIIHFNLSNSLNWFMDTFVHVVHPFMQPKAQTLVQVHVSFTKKKKKQELKFLHLLPSPELQQPTNQFCQHSTLVSRNLNISPLNQIFG